jgi:hypothetical protein
MINKITTTAKSYHEALAIMLEYCDEVSISDGECPFCGSEDAILCDCTNELD